MGTVTHSENYPNRLDGRGRGHGSCGQDVTDTRGSAFDRGTLEWDR